MIEGGRLPFFGVVAGAALFRLATFDELAGVRIVVACRAGRRGRFERRFGQFALSRQGLVALIALDLRVSPQQRKLGF